MKIKTRRSRSASIPHSRWLAYATAGAATALAGSPSAEAAIHYSGILNVPFPRDKETAHKLQLDQPGDSLFFERVSQACNVALFSISGIVSAAFKGRSGYVDYASKLSFGQHIAAGGFVTPRYSPGWMAASGTCVEFSGYWSARGTGYIGFRFNNGAGRQYGWARVTMTGQPENAFKVVAYAYADPGEPIRAGQTSSDKQAPDQGSLGWLALGAVGLLAWRKSRSRAAR